MNIYEDFMSALLEAIEENGNLNQLATKSGLSASTLKRWRDRERVPNLQSVAPLLPYLNWPLSKSETTTHLDKSSESKELTDALKRCDELKAEIDRLRAQLLDHKDKIIELLTENNKLVSSSHEESTVPYQREKDEHKFE